MITYTGNGSDLATLGHGLGKAPSMVIYRKRAAAQWMVQHAGCTGGITNGTSTKQLVLDTVDGEGGPFSGGYINAVGTETVTFKDGATFNNCNASSAPYISYMFAEIPGFSKFGGFTSGSSGDPFVECGFTPSLIFLKRISANDNWYVHDTARDPINPAYKYTTWDNEAVEASNTGVYIDIISNGFVCDLGSIVTTDDEMIFGAWASNPFAGTTPVTAR